MPQSPCCTLLTVMQWPPLWAHLFRMREGIRDWRMKRQCCGLPYHSLQSIDTRLHSPVCNIPMRSHSFKSELPPCRGVIIMTMTDGLLLSVFIASSMSGWSGCFYLSVWQTGVCLIYSGLTQGQGHTVRQLTLSSCVDVEKLCVATKHKLNPGNLV